MSVIDRQVRRARSRLMLDVIMRHLALGVLLAAAAWTVVILVERALVLGIPLGLSAGLVAGVGLMIMAVGVYRRRVAPLGAAVVLDQVAGLKERISTALTCRRSSDPFAQATVHDAEKTAAGLHVPAHVRYHAPDLWPWSLATVVVAVVIFFFMPQLDLLAEEPEPEDNTPAVIEERQAVESALQAQVARVQQRLADKPELAGLQDGLDKLDLPDEPTKTPEDVRREAVKRIEKVSDKLKQQLKDEDLEALDALKRELEKLETPQGDDPGSKLTQALASGDMEAARKAMSDLKKQLEEAAQAGDAEAKAKLAEMQRKLDDLAKQMAKLADQQKVLKDLENKGGLSKENAQKLLEKLQGMDPKQLAEMLQKQLANSGMSQKQIEELAKKIAQNQKLQQQCKSMAQAFSRMAQACRQCQQGSPGSGDGLQSAAAAAMGQLSDLEMAEQMMNELQAQLAELEDLKAGVCQGNCRGRFPRDPNNIGRPGQNPGLGYGPCGEKQRGAHQYQASKAQTRTKGGQIIGEMLIDGPQIKGEASAEVTDAVSSAYRDAQDAIEREEIPRQYQRVVQYYFERLAGLAAAQSKAESADEPPESKPESETSEAPEDD